MKAIIACLFLAATMKMGFCQTTFNQTYLEGSWLYGYHYFDPDTNELSATKYYLTEYIFDSTGTYTSNYYNVTVIHNDTCLRTTQTGFYKLSKRGELEINEYKSGFVPNNNWLHDLSGKLAARKVYLNEVFVTRDSLVERNYYRDEGFTYFKKINQSIKVTQNGLDSCKNFFRPVFIPAPSKPYINKDLHLISALDSTKHVILREYEYIEFSHDVLQPDSNYARKTIWGTGVIDTLRNDTLVVELDYIRTHSINVCPYEHFITTSEIQSEEDKYFATSFDLHHETKLEISSPTSETMQGISGFGMFAGGVTAAIIAPLVSINYKSGEFNENKYYRIAGYSLSAAIICIPVYFIFSPKTYSIIPQNTEPAKNKWYLSY